MDKPLLDTKDIQPAHWDANHLPVKGMGIHLLQYSKGDSMKISQDLRKSYPVSTKNRLFRNQIRTNKPGFKGGGA
ncbi:MAG: hypothetical protein HC862_09470 [Scytonema sp. RU_4_4]|nr:hypothetical protein [Scytonema sp. RU_4_4]